MARRLCNWHTMDSTRLLIFHRSEATANRRRPDVRSALSASEAPRGTVSPSVCTSHMCSTAANGSGDVLPLLYAQLVAENAE